MAYAAHLGALTEELVEAVASVSPQSNSKRFDVLKESTLRKIRHHSFLRTNQFQVTNELDGLEERFRVLNRDGLADALRERLDALAQLPNNFTPDILHFILKLSDQPVQNSKLRDLELLKTPDEDLESPLKWADIAKEDGWDQDRGLWENVDFADDSSDGEYVDIDTKSDASVESQDTSLSSVEARHRRLPTDYLTLTHDRAGFKTVEETQSWRHQSSPKSATGEPQKITITELQAVREVLFMLRGLDSTLFNKKQAVLSPKYQLNHTSWEGYRSLLESFGEAGRQLYLLRSFAKQLQNIPLMQVFQHAVETRLLLFDTFLSNLEAQFVDIKQDVAVSLVKVLNEIKPHLQPLSSFSGIIQGLNQAKYPHPFHYLELLFNATNIAHMEGDENTYKFLGTVFFECFRVYVRPIRLWMETGELLEGDKTFFISKSSTQARMSQVWKHQFKLRKTTNGTLHAPRFLHPATNKIFTTGKSIVVLKHMGRHVMTNGPAQTQEPPLEFDEAYACGEGALTTFSEIFNTAFGNWMQSKHHAASSTLRQALFESYGLWSVLNDLEHIYLMCNGAQSDTFASAIFSNFDLLNSRWHDRFTLTEVAREAYANVDTNRIAVSVSGEHCQSEVHEVRKTVRKGLPGVTLSYRLPWPIQIVLSDESLDHYQAIFTLLIQLRRACYMLQRHHLKIDGVAEMSYEQTRFYRLRSRLLWFCSSLQSYLTTLVIEPLTAELHGDLRQAEDIDDLAAVHSTYAKRMVDEACLGSKLDPIHQCMLDILDLTIRLEDARHAESERAQEMQEISRLSMSAASMTASPRRPGRYMQPSEEEDETFLAEQDRSVLLQDVDVDKTYAELLAEMGADFDRLVKFMCGGLRGVARASSNAAATKWDTLAEMLEVGIQEERQVFSGQPYV
ncbi:hypothetical protein SLS62_003728 [Diatrype stigma]|uniref:Spindle pole body component n=1 Tax=Diatrype stigma TaxID=117547 RepID=A0AAN9UUD3_9PEZI